MIKISPYYILHSISIILVIILLLILPSLSFKFGIISPIFPAVEILFIYYFVTIRLVKLEYIFIITLLLDLLYCIPYGTLALSFLISEIFLTIIRQWVVITNYNINCLIFGGYALLILGVKAILYLIFYDKLNMLELIFQYLTTISCYSSFKILFDKLFNYNAWQQNP